MEEFECQDTLNDETFGSGSFESQDNDWESSELEDTKINEFEKWKQQQKEASANKIPLDEAPKRNIAQDEEKMVQAISKLDIIGFLSPTKQPEEPLPNAHAIESLWPSSPKHSSNIGTPDSTYLQDILLSPTHNIWGSPSSEERKTVVDGPDKSQLTTQHCHDVKQEERSQLYSPVLEDEAVLSALPKRPSKPLFMEDLEKIGFQYRSQSVPSRLPFVRPPPGLSPNPNMSPFSVRPNPVGMYQSSGQPRMSPAQAQAYYAALMKQRMAYASSFCRTPPPSAQQFYRPFYHSDPVHLQRHRPPDMGIPRHSARFITPQARTWNNARGGRGYDNRRSQQNYSEPPNFKYRPQYYVESEEEEEEEEGTLMTAKEKDWLIRIQLMQLTTDKPELDDYYYHTFEKRRLAKERAMRQDGVERESQQVDKNVEMSLPHVPKGDYNYKPAKFEGSLGQVTIGSVYHPREIVQVGDSGKPRGLVGSLKETKKKYQLLLTIEKGFDQILPIEDLARMALQMPQDVRPQLYERRDKLFQRCYNLLNLKSSKDSNKKYDDDMLLQMLSVRKGRRLLSKMLRILHETQIHEIALAITRNLRTMTKKDIHAEEDNLCEALVDVIRGSSSGRVIEHYNNIVGQQDSSVLQFLSNKFTLRIVIEIMKRISELAKNIDAESLPLQSLWPDFLSLTVRDFVSASPKVLARNYREVENLVVMLSDNADASKISIIQEHFRLVENARPLSPPR